MPECDSTSCHFANNAYFHGDVWTGLSNKWTIGIWMKNIVSGNTTPFSVVQVSNSFSIIGSG